MTNMNLVPGQYQIGDFVFGRNTMVPLQAPDVQSYEVNAQDFQVVMSDEIRFGVDSLKPAPIVFTMALLHNSKLDNVAAITGDLDMNFSDDPTIGELIREWKADEVRKTWGELKPILYCRRDKSVVRIYGRPRKLGYKKRGYKGQFTIINAEFMRSDTLCYDNDEFGVTFTDSDPHNITRLYGDADSWVRFVFVGPMNHPVVNFGSHQFELDYNIPAGQEVEVSSYPWQRRVVSSTGLSLAPKFISAKPFLDKLKFEAKETRAISFTATGMTGESKMVFAWRDAWHSLD